MIRRQKDTHPPEEGRPTEGADENLKYRKTERQIDKKKKRRKDKKTPTCQSNQRGKQTAKKTI